MKINIKGGEYEVVCFDCASSLRVTVEDETIAVSTCDECHETSKQLGYDLGYEQGYDKAKGEE